MSPIPATRGFTKSYVPKNTPHRRRRGTKALARFARTAACAAGFWASTAWAQTSAGPSIAYHAPDGCGSGEEVLAKFFDAWGSDREAPSFRATLDARLHGTTYRIDYRAELAGEISVRELDVVGCEAVTEAGALLLLLTADPLLAGTLGAAGLVPEEAASDVGEVPAQPQEPPRSIEGPTPPPRPRRRPAKSSARVEASDANPRGASPAFRPLVWLGLGASVTSSLSPGWAVGPSVDVGVRVGELVLGLRGAYRFGPPVEPANAPGVELRSALGEGLAWIGWSFDWSNSRVVPYVAGGFEVLSVEPSGSVEGNTGTTPFAVGQFGGRWVWKGGRGPGLSASLGLAVPFERPEFSLVGISGPVFVPGVVSFDAAISVFWELASQ